VSFAVLGPKESCTGDPARRLGNEYLFQTQAQTNIETLKAAGVKKVVASCPHCFNTISREYPALGGDFEVLHHTQLLERLLAEGKLRPETRVESGHLPRSLLPGPSQRGLRRAARCPEHVPGVSVTEMHRHKRTGFCCGAGGARMWMEERIGKRINVARTDEALGTGAGRDLDRLPLLPDHARRRHQGAPGRRAVAPESVRVMDVAQVLEQSLPAPAATPPPPTDSHRLGPAGRRQHDGSGQRDTDCRLVSLPRNQWAALDGSLPTVTASPRSCSTPRWVAHQNVPATVSVYW
jgi:hypothetical protein